MSAGIPGKVTPEEILIGNDHRRSLVCIVKSAFADEADWIRACEYIGAVVNTTTVGDNS
ncbi:MAG: hypothetical protein R3C49_13225 [Planctomycetaceae bacterium]